MLRQQVVLLFIAFYLIFSAAPCCATQQNNLNLQAVVKGDSKVLADAFVMLRGMNGQGVWETRTEPNGTFALRVGGGCYHLFVSAGGFLPYAERFCINPDRDTTKLNLKLKHDPVRYLLQD